MSVVTFLGVADAATGVLFDQPQVVAEATPLGQAGLSARAESIGGDFFESIPDGGDCYVIKWSASRLRRR